MVTWVLWMVFVSGGEVFSVPLDRYSSYEQCDLARNDADASEPNAAYLCIQSKPVGKEL